MFNLGETCNEKISSCSGCSGRTGHGDLLIGGAGDRRLWGFGMADRRHHFASRAGATLAAGPVFDLPTTMGKLLAAGLTSVLALQVRLTWSLPSAFLA